MRTRAALLAALLCTALAACSGDGDEPESKQDANSEKPPAKTTDTTIVDCEQFAGTSTKITDAQAALYGSDAAARTEAIRTLAEELEALKEDAPGDVDKALDTLADGFEEAAALLSDPESADSSELAELAPKLAEAGQKVTTYIVDRCQ